MCMMILSNTYNPSKYQALLALLTKLYLEQCSPIPVMQAYLSLFTQQRIECVFGSFVDSEWDNRKALIAPLKKVFAVFGKCTARAQSEQFVVVMRSHP